jgi:glyoxylase-like metal-dependent hydrolase (beta-lactamase superfamily II)
MPATIGPYTLHAIESGRFGLDGGAMFGIVPKPLWASRIAPDDQNRIPLHTRCLLLEGDGRVVLVDTGVGDVFDGTKYADIYAIDDTAPTLLDALDACGIGANDVTDVVLTHLHFDHCGGGTQREGERRVPTFPNATYHVQADHWTWAADSNPKEQGSFLHNTFRPLEARGQLHRVHGATSLFPGVRVRLVHGHTESQQIVQVADDDHTLVYVGDLLPTSHHLAPAWTMAYDVRPLVTIEEKADFLREAADGHWTLFFEHDPEVVTAEVVPAEQRVQVADPRPHLAL